MSEVDGFVWWLGLGDNAAEWDRLRRALALNDGFALLLVVVSDARTAGSVELLVEAEAEVLGREAVVVSPLDLGAEGPVAALTSTASDRPLAILTTLEASSRDQEALLRCLAVVNGKRDQLAERLAGPLVVISRTDARRQLGEVAPDLLSVHAAQFRFARAAEPREAPPWLLPAFEAVGALGLDPSFGPVDRSWMPTFVEEVPELVEPLVGRAFEIELIEGRIAGGTRKVAITGAPGVGRRTVVRAVLERTHHRWERIVWISARLLDDARGVIDALVAVLGDEEEQPPLDEVDLVRRYRQLTARHGVFIVVEDLDLYVELPEPSEPSLLVELGQSGRARGVGIRPLKGPDVDTLWASLTRARPPESLMELSRGLPLCVKLLARWIDSGGASPLARSSVLGSPAHFYRSDSLLLVHTLMGDLAVEDRLAVVALLDANYFGRRFWTPRGMDPRVLGRLGLARLEGRVVVCREPSLYLQHTITGEVPDLAGAVLAALAANRGPPGEFEARVVHEYACRVPNSKDGSESGDWERVLTEQLVVALKPSLRADFLDWLDLPFAALEARLAAYTLDSGSRSYAGAFDPGRAALLRLLVELRPPRGSRVAAKRALFDWERSGAADGLNSAVRGELGRALGIDEGRREPSTDAAVSLIRALDSVDNGDDRSTLATLRQACERDWDSFTIPRKHLAWSGRAWLDIHHARHADARASLAEVEASARAWATPFALLRLRLLELERAVETGDLLRAAADFDDILARCEQVYGPTHPATLALMARGIAVFADIAQPERADALAAACWRQHGYTDEDRRATLYDLGAWWSAHDEARAQAVRERWEASFPDELWPFD